MKKPQLSIILPTYNEAGNIIRLIKAIQINAKKQRFHYEIIVIDDNSPDHTSDRILQIFKRSKTVKVIKRFERGLATAIHRGIKSATGIYILVMDTDFNHDPKEIPHFLKHIKKSQLVIGSRYVNGGGMQNKLRQHLSYLFNLYIQLLLDHTIHDNLSGFFMMKKSNIVQLDGEQIFSGFGEYFIRLIYHAKKRRFTIVETPVYYRNRTYGVSKSRFVHMLITYSLCALKLRLGK